MIGSEERLFERIMLSINHDIRSAMLLAGSLSEEHNSATEIRKRLSKFIQGEPFVENIEGLLTEDASFINYCQVLKSNNFVERLDLPAKTRTGEAAYWAVTRDGYNYAFPAAAHSIRAASLFGVSIFKVLGKTGAPHRSNSRSSYNTAMILLKLYESGELSEVYLSKFFQLYPSDLRDHCVKLSGFGFVKRTVKGHTASDRITGLGNKFIGEFLLPIWVACGDLTYAKGEYRDVLKEYLKDERKMRHDIVDALVFLYRSKIEINQI